MLRSTMAAFAAAALLSACGGGGDNGPDVRSRTCTSPLTSAFSTACAITINPPMASVIDVEISADLTATNATAGPANFERIAMIAFGGDAYEFTTYRGALDAGAAATRPIRLRHTFSGEDTGNRPIIIGLSAFDRTEYEAPSTIRNVTVVVSVR